MKHYLLSLLLFSTVAHAQDLSQMDQGQMQEMMLAMQTFQTCMSKVDTSALQAMQTEALNAQKDVERMCQKGQRDLAQKTAIDFSRRMMHMHVMSEIKACAKNSPFASMMDFDKPDFTKKHVCDGEVVDFNLPQQGNRINW